MAADKPGGASSRAAVLRALRSAAMPERPLPELNISGVHYPDLRAQFAKSVGEVGGRCVFIREGELESALEAIPEYASASRVISLVGGVKKANIDIGGEGEFETDIDFCVLPGRLGVAENGAVWVEQGNFTRRAQWFLAEHMALVVAEENLVHNMHEAYARISLGAPGFCTFISGPSKTADIEQSLVIGAQGPRSCTVLVVGQRSEMGDE